MMLTALCLLACFISIQCDNDESVPEEITPIRATLSEALTGECCDASQAIDKKLARTVTAKINTDTETVWLELALGGVYSIHQLTVYTQYFTDWIDSESYCVQSVEKYQACKDKRSDVDIEVYLGEELQGKCGKLEQRYGLGREDQIYQIDCDKVKGDRVLFSKGDGYITVQEIVVKGTGGDKEDEGGDTEAKPVDCYNNQQYNSGYRLHAAAWCFLVALSFSL